MTNRKAKWAALLPVVSAFGLLLGRSHLVGPNPGTYFALGILAAVSVGGIGYGFREARRVIGSNGRISG